MPVQGGYRSQHDAESDEVGERHADISIELDALQRLARLVRGSKQRFFAALCALFFDLLRRLPEEQVGTDGRAEHGDDRNDVIGFYRKLRQQRPDGYLSPGYMHDEQ